MHRYKIPFILGLCGVLPASLAAGATVKVTEASLTSLARQESGVVAGAESKAAQAKVGTAVYSEKYETNGFAHASRNDTRQRAIFPFAPATGPVDAYELGVQKRLSYGLSTSLSAFTEQVSLSDDSVERATTSGLRLKVAADLWRNLFGALDTQELQNLSSQEQIAELQARVETRAFEMDVRKLYWSLVANQESMLVTEVLFKSAQRQLKDAEARLRDSVADQAEVARYRAQVASRNATMTSLKFRREQLFLQLKSLLPSLMGADLELAAYDLGQTIQQVLICTAQISANKQVPWQDTYYDDVMEELEAQLKAKNAVSEQRDAIDLQLVSEVEYTGIGDSYDAAFDETSTDGMPTYAVSLQLTVPLGGQKSASERLEKAANQASFAAQNLDLKAKLHAHHEQMVPVISMLQQAVRDQEKSAGLLENAIAATEKKFNQARVSVDALINDQNALQASQLEQIETKLAVIHTVLEYFKIFSETKCALNTI